ncbi:MAG: hypothetical protein Q8M19_04380 [Reyranella sp.]|nr:hypothetical protein [Reyranella sp.]
MRLLFASAVALLAVAFAAPSFAQNQTPAIAPVPTAKPKLGTSAYCQTLKSATSRNACLKKVTVAKAQPKATPKASTKTTSKAKTKTTSKTKTKKPAPASAPKQADSAHLPPPATTPPAPAAAPASGTIAIPPLPPLPSKTI